MIQPARFAAVLVLLALVAPPLPCLDAAQVDAVRKSLVRVSLTSQIPDYTVPWNPGTTTGGRGAGFVIAGNRIMTNAHVVSNERFLTVEREGDPEQYVAKVLHVAHDCDLALLSVDDPAFFKGMEPLKFGGIPMLESTVSAYGYPIGGDRMSVTRGVVSRVDFQPYAHSAIDSHLTIQIDAAINPGNSGGPVLQDGSVVGVAFQGFTGDVAQNVGYMIPTPVVKRFLKDVEDGRYDRYVDISINTFPLQNPAMRKALGLKEDGHGVMVSTVLEGGSCEGVLEKGDVLLAIDDFPIASDGFVEIEGERVEMSEVVERKFLGDTVKFRILRAGKESEATATLKTASQFAMQASRYDVEPRFVLFGGLLFQPLSRDFLIAHRIKDLRVQYFFNRYIADGLYIEHPDVVILSAILADPVNAYLGDFENSIIDEVNGVKIKTLDDLAAALGKKTDYHVIRVLGEGRPIVLEDAAVREARPRILARYNVLKEQNLARGEESR